MTSNPQIQPPLTPLRPLKRASGDALAFLAMVRKELTIMARYPVEFVASFGQIFLIVAVFVLAGSTFARGANGLAGGSPMGQGSAYDGIVIYGFMIFMFISDTMWSIAYNVRREQVQGTLEQLYLSPSNKFANLVSRITNILLWTGLLSVAGVWLMSKMLGSLPLNNPALGLYILVFALSGTFGLGFMFAALTLRLKETANTVANFLQFALIILCANFFPFSALPEAVQAVSRLIPIAYGVDAFRSTLMGYPPGFPELAPIETEIIIVSVFGIISPVLGYFLYRAAENYARSKGSLGEY